MRLVSVNVAKPEPVVLNGRELTTAIVKLPVSAPVAVGTLGLDGDEVAAVEHHGGVDQAVYAYSTDDYDWWNAELGGDRLVPGTFGENLTIEGFESADICVGDRFELAGGVGLAATAPRIPCAKLGARMGDAKFPIRFTLARRPGVYLRVIEPGTVETGERVTLTPTTGPSLSMADLVELYTDRTATPARLEAALALPIAERARAHYEQRLSAR
ncbi:MAG: MOSC domain-containing protein [Acidimicrobiia bacterium]|nr:MOSC domain-containing protein [Acidimicrobiia bacterium]